MNKKIISLVILLILSVSLLCPIAYALDGAYIKFERISDKAGVLTVDEKELLEEELVFNIEEYETDFQFILIDNSEFQKSGYSTLEELAQGTFYDEDNPGGYGEELNGIVTVILTDRKYFGFYGSGKGEVLATDSIAEQIYNDSAINSLTMDKNYFSLIMTLMAKYESVLTNRQDVSAGLSVYTGADGSYGMPRIIDTSDVISDEEEEKLLEKINSVGEYCQADFLLIFTDSTKAKDEDELADILIHYYDSNKFGLGENYDGIAMIVDTSERLYFINYFGENIDDGSENTVYIGKDRRGFDYDTRLYIDGFVQPKLEEDDYYGAAAELLRLSGSYLKSGHMPIEPMEIIISIIIGLIVALIVTAVLRKKMKPVAKAVGANKYLIGETLRMRAVIPIFVRSSISRTERRQSSGGNDTSHGGSHGTGTGGRF